MGNRLTKIRDLAMGIFKLTKPDGLGGGMKIKDIGEQGLLKIVQQFCPVEIVGDDAALLTVTEDHSLVVTTDMLVDGVHFSDRTTSPEDVGWRCVAANLSDLAAMGATPIGITVALGLPPEVEVNWIERLYQGIKDCLDKYQTVLVGGDICRSSGISISITALGEVLPHRVIRRDAAKPGDVIVVSGFHGCSRAGLELLLNPEKGKYLEENVREKLTLIHQRPQPRLDVLKHLGEVTETFPVGGMDSSDGLADAVIQLCRCSGVGARLDYRKLPIFPPLLQLESLEKVIDWVLYGGEDFELVLCLPLESAEKLVSQLGEGAAIIGEIVKEKQIELRDEIEEYPPQILSLSAGFQHF